MKVLYQYHRDQHHDFRFRIVNHYFDAKQHAKAWKWLKFGLNMDCANE